MTLNPWMVGIRREGDGEGERCARNTPLVVVDEEGRRDDLAEQDARVVVGAVRTVLSNQFALSGTARMPSDHRRTGIKRARAMHTPY